jgi:SAM-dependent methyltransferase
MNADPTRNFYEAHAKEYFQATSSADLHPLWHKLIERLKPGARILDLGCGSGRDLLYFSRHGYRVVGLDYSFNLLKLASEFSSQPVVQADFRSLPFRSGVFDAAWAIGSLLHVPPRFLPSVLGQIHGVLKPGSLFLTSVKEGEGENVDSLGRHNVFYQKNEWHQILEKHGFGLIESEKIIELRKTPMGNEVEIKWLVCLSKATQRRLGNKAVYDQSSEEVALFETS